MKKTVITTALAAVFGVAAMSAQAATLNNGNILTINDTVFNFEADSAGNLTPTTVASGSFFGMDINGDTRIQTGEQNAITGVNGIIIGSTQGPNSIDTWEFFGAPGTHTTSVAPTGGTVAGIDFSGWTVFWNNVAIDMSVGAWTPLNCGAAHMGCTGETFAHGMASFNWSGNYGDSYTLWYSATVPDDGTTDFGGVKYMVYLEGTVLEGDTTVIPVPAAVWLLGSGLLGLVGVARRRKTQA